jgi:hypothetical protein
MRHHKTPRLRVQAQKGDAHEQEQKAEQWRSDFQVSESSQAAEAAAAAGAEQAVVGNRSKLHPDPSEAVPAGGLLDSGPQPGIHPHSGKVAQPAEREAEGVAARPRGHGRGEGRVAQGARSGAATARRGVERKPERIINEPGELRELHYDNEASQNLRFQRERKQEEREKSFYLTKAQWLTDTLYESPTKRGDRLAKALADGFEKDTYCATRKLQATFTYPQLVKITRDSRPTVIRAMHDLEGTGRLKVVTDYDWKLKRNKPNVYMARGYKIIRVGRTEEGDSPI